MVFCLSVDVFIFLFTFVVVFGRRGTLAPPPFQDHAFVVGVPDIVRGSGPPADEIHIYKTIFVILFLHFSKYK